MKVSSESGCVARSDSVLRCCCSFVWSFLLRLRLLSRQGETDGAKEHRAQTYYERFETLVEDIRGLGYPDLKIFTVAVTGSNGRLSYLQQVCVCRIHVCVYHKSFSNPIRRSSYILLVELSFL